MSVVYGIDIGSYSSKISSILLSDTQDIDTKSTNNSHLVGKFKYSIHVTI